MNRKFSLAAAFLVPFLIIIIIAINHGIYPFGDQCMLHIDMYHQYCPFFTELLEKIRAGGSAFYSWNIGLGADFVSLYAYYLASPLNWLIVLCPAEYVIEFMTILVVIKIALCGLTFTFYLQKHFYVNSSPIFMYGTVIFGAAYALSAFMAAYAWNIMWTDCMVLTPLVILGLEQMVKEGKPLLYYSMLSLSILSNYYISIMICIFLVFWFLLYWLEHREAGFAAWLRFAGYSLLAGGTGAVLIIPTAIMLSYSGAQGVSFPESIEWYFNIGAELARHLVMTDVYTGADHWPNIYSGLFTLILFALYLLNGGISWKRKVPRILLAGFFIVSFSCNILDFFWHGLRFPTSLPGRQSFLYTFLLLVIAFEAFLKLRQNKLWHVLLLAMASVGFLLLAHRFVGDGAVGARALWVSGVFLACYLVLICGYWAGNAKVRRMMLSIGCLAIVAEVTLNYDATGLDTVNRQAYVENLSDYKRLLDRAQEGAQENGELFYRTEELERKTKNDAPLSSYRSATQFSSLMNLNVSHFYQNVGMEGGKNFYCVNGATPLLSAMLSIRYILADNALEESPIRSLVDASGESFLYENAYVLPLGFMMPEEVVDAWDYQNAGDIGAQNNLATLLGSTEQLLVPVPSGSMLGESSFEADEDGHYFATYTKTSVDNLTAEVSGGRTRSYTKVSHGYTLDFGYCEAGSEVKVINADNETVALTVYRLNLSALDTAYRALNRETMELTSFSDTRIAGNIQVSEAGRLIFSIAREEGWTLYLNGNKTQTKAFGGAFLSVYLEPGEYEVELRYETPGIRAGALVSSICLVLFVLCMLAESRWFAKNKK